MKKFFLTTLIFAAFAANVFSQDFGIRVGMTAGLFDTQFEGEKLQTKVNLKLQVGFDVDVPFSSYFSFRTGLIYAQKAAEINFKNEIVSDTNISTVQLFHTFEVPAQIVFRYEFPNESCFYLGVGPSFMLNLAGNLTVVKQSVAGGENQLEYKEKMLFKKNDNTLFNSYNRCDIGLSAFISYKFAQGFTISANYTKGFLNMSKIPDHHYTTGYFGASLGFMINGSM